MGTNINMDKAVAVSLIGEAVPPAMAYRLAVHIGKIMGRRVREPPRSEDWQLPFFHMMFTDYFA